MKVKNTITEVFEDSLNKMYTNTNMIELEYTYLVKKNELPKLDGLTFVEIVDTYFSPSTANSKLRLRKKGDGYEITKKEIPDGADASKQIETTISLSKDEYLTLSTAKGRTIHKNRYYYKEGDHLFEIDVFLDDLGGLIVAEIEFETEDKKQDFVAPAWLLANITQEDFISGNALAGKKYLDIEGELSKFDYNM